MNDFWIKLHQPEYLHVLLNHLPITGLGVASLGLFLALIFRSRGGIILCLWLVMLTCVSVWPVVVTGEAGYDEAYARTDDYGESALDLHMQLAETWSKAYYATAVISAIALIVFWRGSRSENSFGWLTWICAFGCILISGWIAESGGKVVHKEFRVDSGKIAPTESKK